MITHQDKISMAVTFSVGFIAGVYFYFAGFSFEFGSNIPEKDFYEDFMIEGQAYGGCEVEGCLSFQLLADGTYRMVSSQSGVGEVTKNGVISLDLRSELMKNLEEKTLARQAKLIGRRIVLLTPEVLITILLSQKKAKNISWIHVVHMLILRVRPGKVLLNSGIILKLCRG